MQKVHFGQVMRVMLGIKPSFAPVKVEFAADTTVVVPLATAGQGPLQVNKVGFFLQYHLQRTCLAQAFGGINFFKIKKIPLVQLPIQSFQGLPVEQKRRARCVNHTIRRV